MESFGLHTILCSLSFSHGPGGDAQCGSCASILSPRLRLSTPPPRPSPPPRSPRAQTAMTAAPSLQAPSSPHHPTPPPGPPGRSGGAYQWRRLPRDDAAAKRQPQAPLHAVGHGTRCGGRLGPRDGAAWGIGGSVSSGATHAAGGHDTYLHSSHPREATPQWPTRWGGLWTLWIRQQWRHPCSRPP